MRVLAIVLVASCGPSPAPRLPGALQSDEAAIAAFQVAWEHDVRPTIADPLVRRIDNRMQSADALGLYHARLLKCRDGIERVRDLTSNGKSFIVHGTPEGLLGREWCWSVLFMGGMKLDAEGWLDPNGHLLIAWRIPEG